MPPFIPVFSISRSQSVRLGRGPGNQTVPELNSGDTPISPQTGALIGPFYADLGNSFTRRDYQRHQAIGTLVDTGAVSNTVYTDLFGSGLGISAGALWAVTVAAGSITSRYSGAQIAVPATSVTIPGAPLFGSRTDLVVVNNAGVVSLIPGGADSSAPTFDVWSLTSSAALTGGFKLGFSYNGYWFTTGALTQASTGANVATAVLAATGGPGTAASALSAFAPGATVTGAGAALTAAVTQTLTAGGGLEGPITNLQVLGSTLTGGTLTAAHTTVGVGNPGYVPNGSYLVLGSILVPSTATAAGTGTTFSGTSLMLTA